MNFEQLLRQHPDVVSVSRRSGFGFFPTYIVAFRGNYTGAYVTHLPVKAAASLAQLVQDPKGRPWVLIAATSLHDPGLVRMRINDGLAAARHYHRNP